MRDRTLRPDLRDDLRHRLRPMTGRDPDERDRSTTPLELLYDLTYVIAFGAAAEQLAHHISEGHTAAAVGAYVFAIFLVTWAWLNFTWFSSAYGNDDALFRIATIVQMVGVIVLTFGLPVSFTAAAAGRSPNNALLVVGYVIMRVPLIALWLRASKEDGEHRRTAMAYATTIAVAQLAWILTAVLPLSAAASVGALVDAEGWTAAAVVVIASGLILAAALWWAYFLIPSRSVLVRWPERTMLWRYAHLPMFGAIAAVGTGLRVAASAVEERSVSLLQIALSLAVPLACVLVTIFLTWSVLTGSYDLTHVPLLLATLLPLGAAVSVGAFSRKDFVDAEQATDLRGLVFVVALVAAGAIVEVVGHELVGFTHTVDALQRGSGVADKV